MPQRITIDLKKNPEAADAIIDLEVGDEVTVVTTIVSKDEQSAILEVEEVVAGEGTEEIPETESKDEEEDAMPQAMKTDAASDEI